MSSIPTFSKRGLAAPIMALLALTVLGEEAAFAQNTPPNRGGRTTH